MATRIGVDVGGTFTDLVTYDDETGEVRVVKEPTTPVAPEEGVIEAVRRGVPDRLLRSAEFFLHGTTVGLNALLERRGAIVGLLATSGFRDVLETRRGDRDDPYDLFWRPPEPLVPRDLRLPVTERVLADGSVETPLDPADLARAFETFRSAGVSSQAMPETVPAASGGDICALVWWGTREGTGEPWTDGAPYPIGHGAHARGDGASSLIHVSEAATRFPPAEVWEAKNPSVLEKVELAPDSCGPGRHRGGLGLDLVFRALEDSWLTSTVERQSNAPWGLAGGGEARPNAVVLVLPDGKVQPLGKATRVPVPRGARVELRTGGGGGYGPAAERDPEAVRDDLRNGYVTEEHARRFYPHAV